MLLRRYFVVAKVIILLLLSNLAEAQGPFYIFGSLGNTSADIAFGGLNRVDDDDISYALGAGFVISEILSIEGAYHDFGSHNGETDCPPDFACLIVPVSTKADLTGISLSLIGSVPVADRFEAYGKVGVVSWDTDFSGISSAFNTSGEDLLYGVGLRWSIEDRWRVSAEYSRVDLDLDTARIGLSYHF